MHFLSPIWFFALAASSIPLLIHLWNIRPGKTLKVGSISLINEASKTTRRNLKLLDLLLLALRCLLLALLAVFLASPVWRSKQATGKVKGWVLIPENGFNETYKTFKTPVDSLIKAGYELHYFRPDFRKLDSAKMGKDTASDTALEHAPLNYWSVIRRLQNKVAATMPAYVFTPNGLTHFVGSRPSVALNLRWQTYTAADSVSLWIAAASFAANNAIKVTTGNSTPAGIFFTNSTVQNGDSPNSPFKVAAVNGRPYVSLKNSDQKSLPVDTAALSIAIYTDRYAVDADYLKAALVAVTKFSGRKAVVKQYTNAGSIPAGQTWLFWLSDNALSSRLQQGSKHIFKYETGKAVNTSTWIQANGSRLDNSGGIPLFKSIAQADNFEPVWQDGFGKAVLSLQADKEGQVYRFYSHFNPLWNDLVWSNDFPKLMLKLLAPDMPAILSAYDKRVLTNAQIQPVITKQIIEAPLAGKADEADISKYFWLLLVAVFLAERILANKNKTAHTNG